MSPATPQTHAILGAGGVGGFVAAVLAGAGHRVIMLLRPESYEGYPPAIILESGFGNVEAPVTPALSLTEPADVLWVTPKATQLAPSLALVPDPSLVRMVVPLLNGVDHVPLLRQRLQPARVVPGTIAGEMERTAPGRFVHRSPFLRFGLSETGREGLAAAAEAFVAFGCAVSFDSDELSLLWRKLVMLAPMALNTTAAGKTVGELLADPVWASRFEGVTREACAVAAAEGAIVRAEETLKLLKGMPVGLRSSMQKDVAAGRPAELDGIAGPILRGGTAHHIPVPITAALAAEIAARR